MKMNSVFVVITIILPAVLSQQCGPSNPCPNSMCCSQYGWCGCDAAYCGSGCQNQCKWCQSGGDGNGGIGVNYGRLGNNLPQPSQVVKLIKSLNGVKRVKIFDTDQSVLRAFANSGIKLTVAVTNQEYPTLARSQSAANAWVKKNISPVYPSTDIEIIAVGNEVLSNPDLPRNDLVPAMRNLNNALNSLGYRIKVSTPLATDILAKSYPPSAGEFRNDGGVISSLLDFLRSTNSVFMVNVYTFFSWQGNPKEISLDYALFRGNAVVVRDGDKGYTNLFDAMVDAIYSAMEKAGHPKLQLVIGESGWPSAGATGATVENARTYNAKLVDRMKRNVGTPKRPGFLVTFIFALFNENKKTDPEFERHFGILYPDGSPVYPLLGENTNSSILHSTM